MNNYHQDYLHDYPSTQQAAQPATGIDWDVVMEITPAIVSVVCWTLWGMFLLIPTVFDLHYAPLFSTANNTVFVLNGLCAVHGTEYRDTVRSRCTGCVLRYRYFSPLFLVLR